MKAWLKDKLPNHKNTIPDEHYELIKEIRLAREHWINAQNQLDWVIGVKGEIDYVIYALNATEKKYDVLLKRAKQLNWSNIPFYIL